MYRLLCERTPFSFLINVLGDRPNIKNGDRGRDFRTSFETELTEQSRWRVVEDVRRPNIFGPEIKGAS